MTIRGSERRVSMSRARTLLAGVGFAGAAFFLVSLNGCMAHNTPCYRACMTLHRDCVTRGTTPADLEQCDARLSDCRRRCGW